MKNFLDTVRSKIMGEHKYNQTAIDAKNGTLPPKNKPKLSKRQQDALIRKRIQDMTGLPDLVRAMGGEYFYI